MRKRLRRKRKYKNNYFFRFCLIAVLIYFFLCPTQSERIKPIIYSAAASILVILLIKFSIKPLKRYITRLRYRKSTLYQIDHMSGEDFEKYLDSKFSKMGYRIQYTPKSNDYGADLVLTKAHKRTVVQAKRYNAKVGISAIQQVIGAKAYYKATDAMVVTNSFFTKNAINLAKENNITLIDRKALLKI